MEKKQRSGGKTVSPNRDGADKNATVAQNQHAEQLSRWGGTSVFPFTKPHVSFYHSAHCPAQAGAGAEEAEGRAAGEPTRRAGAEESHLQPDQQREEPQARSGLAETVQHAAAEQVSGPFFSIRYLLCGDIMTSFPHL